MRRSPRRPALCFWANLSSSSAHSLPIDFGGGSGGRRKRRSLVRLPFSILIVACSSETGATIVIACLPSFVGGPEAAWAAANESRRCSVAAAPCGREWTGSGPRTIVPQRAEHRSATGRAESTLLALHQQLALPDRLYWVCQGMLPRATDGPRHPRLWITSDRASQEHIK